MEFELKKWDVKYIEDVAEIGNNPKIAANLRNGYPMPYTLADAKGYVESCIEKDDKGQITRAIVVDGRAVGSIGIFLRSDVYEKSAEMGYWLGEPFWGKGIMSQAVRQLCREAFEMFDIIRIDAEPFAHNQGSRHVLENAGFTLEGIMRKGVYKNGEVFDHCMYSLLKEEMQ